MRRLFLVALVVVVPTAAGCGSSSKDQALTTTTPASASSHTSTVTDAPRSTTTQAPTGGSGDYCDLARSIVTQLKGKFLFDPTNTELADEAAGLSDTMESMSGVAPPEIKADVPLMGSAFKAYAGLMKDADYDFRKIDRTKLTALNSQELEAATKRIDQYNQKVCGIKI